MLSSEGRPEGAGNFREDCAVEVERDGSVAIVRLNQPETLNALSGPIKERLEEISRTVLSDRSVHSIVLTGNGRAFCAGGDIRNMDERRTPETHKRLSTLHHWVKAFANCPKPIVAAVNGLAVGAGFSLALFGDIVCISEETVFRAGFAGIGACPDLGIAHALPRAVGSLRAADILLTNRPVDAQEALSIGLANRIYKADELVPKSLELAHKLANGPVISYGLVKGLMRRAFELPLEAFLEQEAYAQATAFSTEDFAEGVTAFREKRPARFRGA